MTYPGGKDGAGVYQRLINDIPPHNTYIAAFLGDDAIMRRKRPARLNVGIDLNEDALAAFGNAWTSAATLQLYRCDAVEWLRHRFDLYRYGSTASETSGPAGSLNLTTAPGAQAARDAESRAARAATNPATSADVAEYGSQLLPPRGRVPESCDAESIFVYIDPPYRMCTRTSGPMYRHEMTDGQHADLLDVAGRLPCRVMISSYPNEMYAAALAGWRSFTFVAQTRGGGSRTEQVWCNYPEPAELHDSRYLGADKREREKIRRRVRNWTSGLDRMPPLERQAILDAIAGR